MTSPNRRRFATKGLLAIAPHAALGADLEPTTKAPTDAAGDVAVVFIRGPLTHHDEHFGWDSYDNIRLRVTAALATPCRAVILAIDSPGGVATGFLETACVLRQKAAEAGKPLVAYVEGQACSAAYGLACAADRIVAGRDALVGSIGIVECLADQTALDAAMGLHVELVTSGARKADGNPHQVLSSDARAASQRRVDALAEVFASFVEEARPLSRKRVLGLEADVFLGADAVRAGLVDEIATLDDVVASLASNGTSARTTSSSRLAASTGHSSAKANREVTTMSAPKNPARTTAHREPPRPSPDANEVELRRRVEANARTIAELKAGRTRVTVEPSPEDGQRLIDRDYNDALFKSRTASTQAERMEAGRLCAVLHPYTSQGKKHLDAARANAQAEIDRRMALHNSGPSVAREANGRLMAFGAAAPQAHARDTEAMDRAMGTYRMEMRREGNALICGAVPDRDLSGKSGKN